MTHTRIEGLGAPPNRQHGPIHSLSHSKFLNYWRLTPSPLNLHIPDLHRVPISSLTPTSDPDFFPPEKEIGLC